MSPRTSSRPRRGSFWAGAAATADAFRGLGASRIRSSDPGLAHNNGYPVARPERCPSGRRSATGNRVRVERRVAGSNPALSVAAQSESAGADSDRAETPTPLKSRLAAAKSTTAARPESGASDCPAPCLLRPTCEELAEERARERRVHPVVRVVRVALPLPPLVTERTSLPWSSCGEREPPKQRPEPVPIACRCWLYCTDALCSPVMIGVPERRLPSDANCVGPAGSQLATTPNPVRSTARKFSSPSRLSWSRWRAGRQLHWRDPRRHRADRPVPMKSKYIAPTPGWARSSWPPQTASAVAGSAAARASATSAILRLEPPLS